MEEYKEVLDEKRRKMREKIARKGERIAKLMEKSGLSSITIHTELFEILCGNLGWYVQKYLREEKKFGSEQINVQAEIFGFRYVYSAYGITHP